MKPVIIAIAMMGLLLGSCDPAVATPTWPIEGGSIPTALSESAPAATQMISLPPAPTPPDLIFEDGFESGSLSSWSSSQSDPGLLEVSAAAALVESRGLQVNLHGTSPIYVEDRMPSAETRYRARFYFDPNGANLAQGDMHTIFYAYSGWTSVLRIDFRYSKKAGYQVRARALDNGKSWVSTPWFPILDAPHVIEFAWRAATQTTSPSGSLTLWLDAKEVAQLEGIDNSAYHIDMVRLGVVTGLDATTTGTEYFDAFVSHRESYIGPWQGHFRRQ